MWFSALIPGEMPWKFGIWKLRAKPAWIVVSRRGLYTKFIVGLNWLSLTRPLARSHRDPKFTLSFSLSCQVS